MPLYVKLAIILLGIFGTLALLMCTRRSKESRPTMTKITLKNFDDAWNLGSPPLIEQKLRELSDEAKSAHNISAYLQILSQIALTQAMQQQFEAAHITLNEAATLLTSEYPEAAVRIELERGRAFHQQALHQVGNIQDAMQQARQHFKTSYEQSRTFALDFHAANAAHMIAIVEDELEEKIRWNRLAIDLALSSSDKKAKLWLGSLYNNLGQNYLESQDYEKAFENFEKALQYRQQEKYVPNIRLARWMVARALRGLEQYDKALAIQLDLLQEYEALEKSNAYDMPYEAFKLARGWVYEELAELYQAKSQCFATLAYNDLSKDEMFKKTAPERLERLKELQ